VCIRGGLASFGSRVRVIVRVRVIELSGDGRVGRDVMCALEES
jgi:hypothetical protein